MSERLFTATELARLCGAELFRAPGGGEKEIFSVVCDSREARAGSLFVALKGERTDGRLYLNDAFSRGAAACLIDKSFWEAKAGDLRGREAGGTFVIVNSPLAALHVLAARHMESREALRIGITGSSGKTTTKEITGAILSQAAPSFINKGNLNSEIGLPLSVFGVKASDEFAVFEMGMNHEGEMDTLAGIVRPQAAVITNIGSAHIGILGSRRNIAAEKKKLFLALPPEGKAYVYEAEPFRAFLADDVAAEVLPFGETTTAGFQGADDAGLEGWDLRLDGGTVRFPLPGLHNLRNALAAISLCKGLGVSANAIRAGLSEARPLFGRGEVLRGDITVLLDCYNANPESMENALAFVSSLEWKGRKIAVLGAMKELGEFSAEGHRNIGKLAANSGLDALFFFGEEMEEAYRVPENGRFDGELGFFTDFVALSKAVSSFAREGDLVLVKGSRAMALERLGETLVCAGGVHV